MLGTITGGAIGNDLVQQGLGCGVVFQVLSQAELFLAEDDERGWSGAGDALPDFQGFAAQKKGDAERVVPFEGCSSPGKGASDLG